MAKWASDSIRKERLTVCPAGIGPNRSVSPGRAACREVIVRPLLLTTVSS
jgi:hypothetical protein